MPQVKFITGIYMAPEITIVLCIAGIVCIALEVYLPGGIMGLLGAAALIWSIVAAYQHNSNFGTMLLICGVGGICIPLLV